MNKNLVVSASQDIVAHQLNDAICTSFSWFSNCVNTVVKIVMDSFSDSYDIKRWTSTWVLFDDVFRQPGEESPLGLLLCTEGSSEQIELLQLDKSGIRVAQYLTELPSREILQEQIRRGLEQSKELIDNH